MEPIKVLLVDDHALFRQGVAGALASQRDIQVVGEAGNGVEALSRARELMPDVILMDISMPICDGLEATRRITVEVPSAKIIILTVAEQDESLFEAIKSGAHGYLLKSIEPRPLMEALRGVVKGEAPISRVTAAKILTEFARHAKGTGAAAPSDTRLTEREREVLGLLASGTTNKEIAAALGISPSTVKSHLQNIMDKLHLENRVQAAAFALREGLMPGPSAPPK
ncbi:MAG TPA: response regulator transcription factor [Dehalococcoidia bacterium]|nr:response regulator transcription factor [Dehalococcoidia bacterium]